MSRARTQSGPTISLFPFLAVLLCTMGALLVVLVIFSQSAKQAGVAAAEQAKLAAEAAGRAHREELELVRDEIHWRIDHTTVMRDQSADELAKARLQLAGTEETARKLADELEAIVRQAEAIDSPGDDAEADAIRDLEQRLADATKVRDAVKDGLADKPPAYAVVPYEGANGTHRRPLYIECCLDGVYLQPEGIRLGPGDFEGPPGPGNPLASALRAAREHIARTPGESGDTAVQPYPLLLVRPSGVMAYYAARESIQSWGNEFGYQFIDEDWTLTYPPPDAVLAEAETRAVEEARRRLEWLAQTRPARPSKPAVQYRAATTRGGVVANGGPSVLGDQSRFDWTEDQAGAAGGAGRGFHPGTGNGDGGTGSQSGGGDAILGNRYAGPSKFYAGANAAGGGNSPGGQASTGDGALGGAAAGTAGGAFGAVAGGEGAAGSGSGATSGDGGSANGSWDQLAGVGGAGSASSTDGSGLLASGSQGGGEAGEGGPTGSSGSGTTGSTSAGSGSGGKAGESAGGGSGGMAASTGAGGGGGGSGPSMPGLAQGGGSAGGASGMSASMTASLSGRRGSNWASLATHDNPVPLTRPIRLECAADEFRILGAGGRVESRIPIGTRTVDSIDPLVHEVHATVGRWGLAGDRMYWKPELVLTATPDGVGRRDDLERLLADSGIDTRRSEAKEKVRNLPPVQRTGSLFPRR